jgi:hypothetical protein
MSVMSKREKINLERRVVGRGRVVYSKKKGKEGRMWPEEMRNVS